MADSLADFFQLAELEFSWLVTEFGFREVSRNSKTIGTKPMFGEVGWASSRTFVEVILECINQPYLYVTFGALVGGQMPSVMDTRRRYHLSALLVVRAHDEKRATKLGVIASLRKSQLERGLSDCAKTLREQALDVLADDHSIFKDLAAFGEWQMSQYRANLHASRARALPPDMGLRRLGWSHGSKRSRSKPQSHDHGNDTEHAGCHKNQDAEGVDDGRAAVSGGEQIRVRDLSVRRLDGGVDIDQTCPDEPKGPVKDDQESRTNQSEHEGCSLGASEGRNCEESHYTYVHEGPKEHVHRGKPNTGGHLRGHQPDWNCGEKGYCRATKCDR